jgi:hypothetical protein
MIRIGRTGYACPEPLEAAWTTALVAEQAAIREQSTTLGGNTRFVNNASVSSALLALTAPKMGSGSRPRLVQNDDLRAYAVVCV